MQNKNSPVSNKSLRAEHVGCTFERWEPPASLSSIQAVMSIIEEHRTPDGLYRFIVERSDGGDLSLGFDGFPSHMATLEPNLIHFLTRGWILLSGLFYHLPSALFALSLPYRRTV